ncbi:MAG: YkgJ family cysteine cluster protein, partial [Candidatus Hadarchaeales archaeon]
KKRSGVCVFLKDKACRIYDIRPISCSIYPFEIRKSNGAIVFEPSEECPGIGLGCPVADSEFRKMAEKARKIFDLSSTTLLHAGAIAAKPMLLNSRHMSESDEAGEVEGKL